MSSETKTPRLEARVGGVLYLIIIIGGLLLRLRSRRLV